MKKILVLTVIALLNLSSIMQVKHVANKSKSTLTYTMNHPLHSWTGVNKNVTVAIVGNTDKTSISQVAVSTTIASFDSDNANRDSHVIEATEAIKHPHVKFYSTSITTNGDNLSIKGKLTFHGVTKDISFTATKKTENKVLTVTGGFSINMTNYGITPPSFTGISVDDEIKLKFTMIF